MCILDGFYLVVCIASPVAINQRGSVDRAKLKNKEVKKKMPGGDGTGPVGQSPTGSGRGLGRAARFAGPEGECRCPSCGYHEKHQRGVPCNTKTCPKCNAQMIRA